MFYVLGSTMRTKPEYPCSSDEVNLTTCSRSQDEDEKTKKKKTSEAIDITAAAMARHPALYVLLIPLKREKRDTD